MDREDWNRRYEGRELLWTAEANRFVVAEISGLQPGVALDLGCGEGRNAVWLAEQGWLVTAVDFSHVALDKARRLADQRGVTVEWVQADLLEFEPGAGAFDLVLVAYVQLPTVERRRVLGRATAALASGGTLLVVGHDLTNLTEGHGGPQDPSVLYTPEDIVAELGSLQVVRAERVRRPVTTEAGEVEAIDTLVRAVRP
ncbi:MAG: methyltransferase domain-containing protein [Acidimicrobiia bacterium]|nr:methyltransferase domain-containing protein [Acidimicrobiia bacterium]